MNTQLVKFVHKLNRHKFNQEPGSYTAEEFGSGFSAKEKLFFPWTGSFTYCHECMSMSRTVHLNCRKFPFVNCCPRERNCLCSILIRLVSCNCLCLNKCFCDSLVNIVFDPAEPNQENLCWLDMTFASRRKLKSSLCRNWA